MNSDICESLFECLPWTSKTKFMLLAHVDAALFQFEVIPLLVSADTLAFVLGIKLQLSRIHLIDTH